jgi:hypothetical protein
MRRALLIVLLVLAATPAGASARGFGVPAGPPPLRPLAAPVRDRILTGRPPAALAARAAVGTRYRLPDGSSLSVSVSRAYQPVSRAAIQAFITDVFGPLLHGSEMGRLSVRVETPSEVAAACGGGESLACYDPERETMFVPGQETPPGQPPLKFVVAHEYGHHIATHRRNDPWYAGTWGPKRWATVQQVCGRVARHRFFPGDEGRHYRSNPGEGWAESYAMHQYPQYLPYWSFAASLKPDAASFAAIRSDVLSPWAPPRRRVLRARLGPRHHVMEFRVATPLDGLVTVLVTPSRGLRVAVLGATGAGRLLVGVNGGRARIPVCGWRSVQVRVVRRSGRGTARITVSHP